MLMFPGARSGKPADVVVFDPDATANDSSVSPTYPTATTSVGDDAGMGL
jgi:hypothetical protein